ncbi:hypothetical protein COO91_06779 [Nostoc flagelliforme CCNUN1]|uniref:Uncharacterized protein n=1 Tax=Nostoc flagelliforme CCNUN1 TaxID=2038116 RepID=A0A2K8SZ87_9NOSO|nr:hypothetical protein COO91_06779 [Nostoc flagelliforme CCNUN1]
MFVHEYKRCMNEYLRLILCPLDYLLNPKNPTPNPSPQAGRGDKAQLWRGGVLLLWVIWRT